MGTQWPSRIDGASALGELTVCHGRWIFTKRSPDPSGDQGMAGGVHSDTAGCEWRFAVVGDVPEEVSWDLRDEHKVARPRAFQRESTACAKVLWWATAIDE